MSAKGKLGWPLVALSIYVHSWMCFIDTSIEATLKVVDNTSSGPTPQINMQRMQQINTGCNRFPSLSPKWGKPSFPSLETQLTLYHTSLNDDWPFPGAMLIAIDLLKWVDFTLLKNSPQQMLTLWDQPFLTVYTEIVLQIVLHVLVLNVTNRAQSKTAASTSLEGDSFLLKMLLSLI